MADKLTDPIYLNQLATQELLELQKKQEARIENPSLGVGRALWIGTKAVAVGYMARMGVGFANLPFMEGSLADIAKKGAPIVQARNDAIANAAGDADLIKEAQKTYKSGMEQIRDEVNPHYKKFNIASWVAFAAASIASGRNMVNRRKEILRVEAFEAKATIDSILEQRRGQNAHQPTIVSLNGEDLAAHNSGLATKGQNLGQHTAASQTPAEQRIGIA